MGVRENEEGQLGEGDVRGWETSARGGGGGAYRICSPCLSAGNCHPSRGEEDVGRRRGETVEALACVLLSRSGVCDRRALAPRGRDHSTPLTPN